MPVRLFNTLSGQKEDFAPLQPPLVNFYVCGVTVYDYCHVGHARTYVTFDVVRRHLQARGYQVRFVKNFTDVDDKIIKKALALGEPASAVSERFIAEYYTDMDALGIGRADIEPKVTTHLPEIVALIERLVQRGHAYVVAGDVYFEVSTFPTYLQLSGRQAEELEAGARVDVDERKRHPHDFALWKSAKAGEPSWPSPWGEGRPGWHIECSAMALKHLGETLDIHAGGRDLIFPHHENEVAQSEAATGHPLAKYWMHSGMLNIDDQKMSKSLGNFFTIRELRELVDDEALRLFFLGANYRGPMNFDLVYHCPGCQAELTKAQAESLTHAACQGSFSSAQMRAGVRLPGVDDAERRLTYFYRTLLKMDQFLASAPAGAATPGAKLLEADVVSSVYARFSAAMDDDFNTAAALSELSPALKLANDLCDKPPKPREQALATVGELAAQLRQCFAILGVCRFPAAHKLQARRSRLAAERGIDAADVQQQIEARQQARAEKRFADADAVRVALQARGVVLKDLPGSTEWDITD